MERDRDSAFRGFTLIELLVVVAIMAVLIAVLLPALATAREVARGAVCLSNMRQIATANFMYGDTYGAWPTAAKCTGGHVTDSWVPGGSPWGYPPSPYFDVTQGALWPFLRNKAVYVCPSVPPRKLGYSVNARIYELGGYPHPDQATRSTARLIVFVDEGAGNDGYFVPIRSDHPSGYNSGNLDGCLWPHLDKASFGFADGHGELRHRYDLEIIFWDRRPAFWGPTAMWYPFEKGG